MKRKIINFLVICMFAIFSSCASTSENVLPDKVSESEDISVSSEDLKEDASDLKGDEKSETEDIFPQTEKKEEPKDAMKGGVEDTGPSEQDKAVEEKKAREDKPEKPEGEEAGDGEEEDVSDESELKELEEKKAREDGPEKPEGEEAGDGEEEDVSDESELKELEEKKAVKDTKEEALEEEAKEKEVDKSEMEISRHEESVIDDEIKPQETDKTATGIEEDKQEKEAVAEEREEAPKQPRKPPLESEHLAGFSTSNVTSLDISVGAVPEVDRLEHRPATERQEMPDIRQRAPTEFTLESAEHARDFRNTARGCTARGHLNKFQSTSFPIRIDEFSTCFRVFASRAVTVRMEAEIVAPNGRKVADARGEIPFVQAGKRVDYVVEWEGFSAPVKGTYEMILILDRREVARVPFEIEEI